MERIGPDHRAVVVLRIEHELSLEEIARVLDIEVGTVKSRLTRARAALASAIASNLDEGSHGRQ
jgi:RNA polymerase sigma-70 factor (ECF subfamily)